MILKKLLIILTIILTSIPLYANTTTKQYNKCVEEANGFRTELVKCNKKLKTVSKNLDKIKNEEKKQGFLYGIASSTLVIMFLFILL